MGKVVTSQGLQEFVQTGKFDEVKADAKPKSNEAPALEVKGSANSGDKVAEPKADDYKDDDQETQAEIDKSERFKKLIGKKHYEMKKAQAEAESADRLAEEQFNRARLAEQKLAEYDVELKRLKAETAPKPEAKAAKPDPAKFNDEQGQFKAFEYAEALAAWSADQSIAKYKADQEAARVATEQQVQEAKALELVNKTKAKYADYDEAMKSFIANNDKDFPQPVIAYLGTSDHIGELNYYLATHPDAVARISQMNPLKGIAALRDIELTFEKPAPPEKEIPAAPKVISGAPPPITPLPSSSAVNVNTDPARMDFKELRAYHKAQERAKRH